MHKILKKLLIFGLPLLLVFALVFKIKPYSFRLSFGKDYSAETVLKNVDLTNVAVFLYDNTYESRYLITSDVQILNPVVNIKEDSFFPTLLQYHSQDLCFVGRTINLPKDSSLYKVFNKKDNLGPNWIYISCPIFINDC